jgi:hypothetical protein
MRRTRGELNLNLFLEKGEFIRQENEGYVIRKVTPDPFSLSVFPEDLIRTDF